MVNMNNLDRFSLRKRSGFDGYVGIEHDTEGRKWESIEEIRVNLDTIRRTLANERKG